MSLTNAPETVPPERRVHPVDEVLPAPRLLILGLQHLFIMYAGAVAVPLIVGGALGLPTSTIGLLVNADLFVSGIATVIQSVGIGKIFGVRLPVVAGATFTVLSPMIVIAQKYGLPTVYGAMLCSGVFGLLIAKPFSMLARGLATDALSAVLAGFLNSFPDTAFAENVGLVGLTRVRSRWVVTSCGTMLILLGLLPKIGQVVASVPGPVIGGAATVMFAMVTAVGIQTLHKVNFDGNNNLLIVAVSLAAGLLPAVAPSFYEHFPNNFQVIFGSSITSTVIVVFTLNIVFNHWSWRRQGTESAVEVAVREGAVAVNVPDDGVRNDQT